MLTTPTPPPPSVRDRTRRPAVLVLSTADWDRPLWTNKQHLAARLAASADVLYVNSLGLRRPGLSRADLARVATRTRRIALADRSGPVPPLGLDVVTPRVLPFHRHRPLVWEANRRLLRASVGRWLAAPPEDRVLWTFSPVTYGLEQEAAAAVYHCVDLVAEFPGVDAVAVAEGEAALAAAGVTAVASSEPVGAHLRSVGFASVEVWPNVADVSLYRAEAGRHERDPGAVVFAGNLTPAKIDVDLLRQVVEACPELRFHLAGSFAEGGGRAVALSELARHPAITVHGPLAPPELARLLARSSVGIVPYALNRYTRGVFPMKVYEYLAAGLAVVTTPLPSLPEIPHVAVAPDAASFAARLRELARPAGPEVVADRVAAATGHSWDDRMRQVGELVGRSLAAGSPG